MIDPTIFLKKTDKLILNKSLKGLCEMIRSFMFIMMPEDQQVYTLINHLYTSEQLASKAVSAHLSSSSHKEQR